MAGEEAEELDIKIIADEEANTEAAQAADEKAVQKAGDGENKDAAVADIAAQYQEIKDREAEALRRAEAAERRAQAAETQAETAKKQVANSQLDTIVTALNAAKSDAEQAKRDIRIAKEAGDIEAEIEAQDRLAQSRADERRLDEAKSDLEARAKAPPRRQDAEPADIVEAYVRGRTAPTANWLRAHPEFIRDPRKQSKLTAAHYDAEAEGLVADTPEYFAYVEEFLGLPVDSAAASAASQRAKARIEAPQRRASAPVAPAGPAANGGNGSSGGTTVTLTKGENLAATDGTHTWNYDDPKGKFKKGDPIGVQEFARRKLAMMKRGDYDRTYSEQ